METLVYVIVPIFIVWFGWSLLKMGIKVIKEDERGSNVKTPSNCHGYDDD